MGPLLNVHVALQAQRYAEGGKSVERTNRSIERSSGKAEKGNKALAASFRTVGTAIVASGVVAFARNAAREFASYQTGLNAVGKTSDLAGAGLQRLGASIQALAKGPVPVGRDQLLELAEVAGQLGVEGEKNIGLFTETLGKLSAASSDFKGAEAAETLAQLLNVANEGPENIGRLASQIVRLGNDIATTEGKVAEIAREVGLATSSFRIGTTAVVGISGGLAQLGVRAQGAGSVIGRVFRLIDASVRDGGKELAALAEVAGVSGQALADAFGRDKLEAFNLIIAGLGRIDEAGGSVTGTLEDLGLAGEKNLSVLPTLAAGYAKFAEAQRLAADEAEQQNALNQEAARAFDSLASDVKRTQATIQAFVTTIGAQLEPAIRETLAGLRGWLDENEEVAESIGQGLAAAIRIGAESAAFLTRNVDLLRAALVTLIALRAPAFFTGLSAAMAAASVTGGRLLAIFAAGRGGLLLRLAGINPVALSAAVGLGALTLAYQKLEAAAESGGFSRVRDAVRQETEARKALAEAVREQREETDQLLLAAQQVGALTSFAAASAEVDKLDIAIASVEETLKSARKALESLKGDGSVLGAFREDTEKERKAIEAATAVVESYEKKLKLLEERKRDAVDVTAQLGLVIANEKEAARKAKEELESLAGSASDVTSEFGKAVEATKNEVAALELLIDAARRGVPHLDDLEEAYRAIVELDLDEAGADAKKLLDIARRAGEARRELDALREKADQLRESFVRVPALLFPVPKDVAATITGLNEIASSTSRYSDSLDRQKRLLEETKIDADALGEAFRSVAGLPVIVSDAAILTIARAKAEAKKTEEQIENLAKRMKDFADGKSFIFAGPGGVPITITPKVEKKKIKEAAGVWQQEMEAVANDFIDALLFGGEDFGDLIERQLLNAARLFLSEIAKASIGGLFKGGGGGLKDLLGKGGPLNGIKDLLGGRAFGGGALGTAGAVFSTAAIGALAFKVVSDLIDKKKLKNFGAQIGFSGGVTFSGRDSAISRGEAEAQQRQLQQQLDGIIRSLGGFVTDLPAIAVQIRNDGEKFRAVVNNEILGTFDSFEEAFEVAVLEGLGQADLSEVGPNVAALLANVAQSSLESLGEDIGIARLLDDLAAGVSAAGTAMRQAAAAASAAGQELVDSARRLGLDVPTAVRAAVDGFLQVRAGALQQLSAVSGISVTQASDILAAVDAARAYNDATKTEIQSYQRRIDALLEQQRQVERTTVAHRDLGDAISDSGGSAGDIGPALAKLQDELTLVGGAGEQAAEESERLQREIDALREGMSALDQQISESEIVGNLQAAANQLLGPMLDGMRQWLGQGFLAGEQQRLNAIAQLFQLTLMLEQIRALDAATQIFGVGLIETLANGLDVIRGRIESGDFGEPVSLPSAPSVPRPPSGGGGGFSGSNNRANEIAAAAAQLERLRLSAQGVSDGVLGVIDGLADIDEFRASLERLGFTVEQVAQGVRDSIQLMTDDILAPFEEIIRQAGETDFQTQFRQLTEGYQEALDQARLAAEAAAAANGTTFQEEFDRLRDVIAQAFDIQSLEAVQAAIDDLVSAGDAEGLAALKQQLAAIFDSVPAGLQNAFRELLDSIPGLILDANPGAKPTPGGGDGEPVDPPDIEGFFSTLGVATEAARRQAEDYREALDGLAAAFESGDLSLDRFRAGLDEFARDAFLGLGDSIVGLVDRYGLEIEGFEEFRRNLEELRFRAQIIQLRFQLEMWRDLGVFSREQLRRFEDMVGQVEAAAEGIDFGSIGRDVPPAAQAASDSIGDVANSLDNLRQEADDFIRAGLEATMGRTELAVSRLTNQYDDLVARMRAAGLATDEVTRSFNSQMQAIIADGLGNLRDALSDVFADDPRRNVGDTFAELRGQFDRLVADLFAGNVDAGDELAQVIPLLIGAADGLSTGAGLAFRDELRGIFPNLDDLLGGADPQTRELQTANQLLDGILRAVGGGDLADQIAQGIATIVAPDPVSVFPPLVPGTDIYGAPQIEPPPITGPRFGPADIPSTTPVRVSLVGIETADELQIGNRGRGVRSLEECINKGARATDKLSDRLRDDRLKVGATVSRAGRVRLPQ